MMRKAFFIVTTAVLIVAVFAGIVSALDVRDATLVKANLENVRGYAAANHAAAVNYAVDNGQLFAGRPGEWRQVTTPADMIVGAVALDSARPGTLYIGAANDLTVYRSTDSGKGWMRVPLTSEFVGGVTALAVDSVNHLVYAGTDTAGVFRLRDVGTSMIAGGHTPMSEPVVQVATDNTGAGLAFVRTPMNLYRAENGGLDWSTVENLGSTPTALAIANSYPATVYVGTTDRGLLSSRDGQEWTMANDGLGLVPGSRLKVDALSIDPAQLDVMYVATSYIYGSSEYHQSPVGVAMTTNGAGSWSILASDTQNVMAELLPMSGQTGAVYALTIGSRMPQALGSAPVIAETQVTAVTPAPATNAKLLAWIVAGLAALALGFALFTDAVRRSKTVRPVKQAAPTMRPQTANGR